MYGSLFRGRASLERSVWKRKINFFLLFIPLVLFITQHDVAVQLEEALAGLEENQRLLAVSSLVLLLAALSLIPLAGFLESAVEELAELLGQFLGGLLHTTASNVAELALALSVLTSFAGSRGSEIVLSSVAGVIVRNALLFLGIATLLGCWRNGKMRFSPEAAGEYSTVFALAVTGLSLPTLAAYVAGATAGAEGGGGSSAGEAELLVFGHVPFAVCIAVVLLVSYVAYLVFVVFKPRSGYNMAGKRAKGAATTISPSDSGMLVAPDTQALFEEERSSAETKLSARAQLAAERRAARAESGERRFLGEHKVARGLIALLILLIAAVGVVSMSEHFADSVKEMVEINPTLREYEFFLGLILIPVLAGVVELYGSVGMARRKKMDITMAITAGASIQMILLVVPILVLVGWLTGHPLGLVFTPLNVIIFGAATFAFMLLSRDGESTMLEGVQLVALWLLLAVVALFLHP
jgi:Ca2+:H+ antiporter